MEGKVVILPSSNPWGHTQLEVAKTKPNLGTVSGQFRPICCEEEKLKQLAEFQSLRMQARSVSKQKRLKEQIKVTGIDKKRNTMSRPPIGNHRSASLERKRD